MNHVAIRKLQRILASLVFASTFFFTPHAHAILIEAISSSTDVNVGETFRIDIVISGLEQLQQPQLVRGYHLDLAYSPAIATATDVLFGDYLGLSHPLTSFLQKSAITDDNVMLEENSLWSDPILSEAQPDSFRLASIDFLATDLGTLNFDFLPYLNFGIDVKGRGAQLLPVDHRGGWVNINPLSVPEPATVLLLGIGLFVLAAVKNRGGATTST